MRLTLPLNSFNAVAAGQVATSPVAPARRIHGFLLKTNATDATQLDRFVREVRVKLGSVSLHAYSIPVLYALLGYYGIPVGAGEIPLLFSRSQVRTPTGEEFTALNAFGLSDLRIEVEFRSNEEYNALADVETGFVPTLSGTVEYDTLNDANRSFIQIVPRGIENSGAGDTDFSTLERDGAYKAVHIFSNLVSRVIVYRDGLELVNRTLADVNMLNRRYGLTAQANHFPVDFGYTNQAMDVLEMQRFDSTGKVVYQAGTFNLKVTTTAGGVLPATIEKVIKV